MPALAEGGETSAADSTDAITLFLAAGASDNSRTIAIQNANAMLTGSPDRMQRLVTLGVQP